jgi:HPt (histidine-containing phosphotransfer) domain-containing protein
MSVVLDTEQLQDVTLGDPELMREIVSELVSDTAAQLETLQQTLAGGDPQRCARVAHTAKGACANVGARALAELFFTVERKAAQGDLDACGASMPRLSEELARLRECLQSL